MLKIDNSPIVLPPAITQPKSIPEITNILEPQQDQYLMKQQEKNLRHLKNLTTIHYS